MAPFQPGILEPVPAHARYLEFGVVPGVDPLPTLRALAGLSIGAGMVIGIGPALARRFPGAVEGLRGFPALVGPGCAVPSTQTDLWCWMRDDDRGYIVRSARKIARLLGPAFYPDRLVDGFRHGSGLDLTGYEDGTENPKDEAAIAAAFRHGAGAGRDGSSFVAVQQWRHDFARFEALTPVERDDIIGRRLYDNTELADAPASAHVKRTAQESFEPAAFVLRRSMPWADASGEGLMFVAFGHSFDAFEAQLRRMIGLDDGIVDGLFRFSRPLSGSYFWCPPLTGGRLDLSALGL